jgi:hypothetical protein
MRTLFTSTTARCLDRRTRVDTRRVGRLERNGHVRPALRSVKGERHVREAHTARGKAGALKERVDVRVVDRPAKVCP